MIDEDRCVNIISKLIIEKMGLKNNHTHNHTLLGLIRTSFNFPALSHIYLVTTMIVFGMIF